MANRATINGERTVTRIVGRLDRARKAIATIEKNTHDLSIFSVEKRGRFKRKAIKLKEEERRLATELKSIRGAIDSSVDA